MIKSLQELPCEMLQIETTRNGSKRHENHWQYLLDLILKLFKFHRHDNLILCWWLRHLVSSFNIWFNTLQIWQRRAPCGYRKFVIYQVDGRCVVSATPYPSWRLQSSFKDLTCFAKKFLAHPKICKNNANYVSDSRIALMQRKMYL